MNTPEAALLGSPAPSPIAGTAAVSRQHAAAAVADLHIAGMYVPAGPGPEPIAGDFYDVLPLGHDLVALLVGDVAGHGPGALDAMRGLRSAARAIALEQPGPASVLARLDEVMELAGDDQYATLWYGEYRPSTGTLTYASAGHPPPALHTHGGVLLLAEAHAPALGTGIAHATATQDTQVLPPGAILVAYSDGLIERRGTDFDDQLALLTTVIDRSCDPGRNCTAETIAADILDALVPDPDSAQDDVCLLIVRRQPH
jgi:serine phosphatase RsbU (regulator of sigma subunit)